MKRIEPLQTPGQTPGQNSGQNFGSTSGQPGFYDQPIAQPQIPVSPSFDPPGQYAGQTQGPGFQPMQGYNNRPPMMAASPARPSFLDAAGSVPVFNGPATSINSPLSGLQQGQPMGGYSPSPGAMAPVQQPAYSPVAPSSFPAQMTQPSRPQAPYAPPTGQMGQFNQYGQSPQPSKPAVPFFLDPNGPYAHIGAPPARRKRKSKKFKLVMVAFVLVFVIGIIAIIAKGGGSNPDTLFVTAMQNSLSTHSYSKKEVIGQDNIQLKQDVNDIKAPRQSGTLDFVSATAKLEGYSSIQNSYARYTQLPATANNSTVTILNKWEQIRKNGMLPDSYKQFDNLEDLFDARSAVMGGIVIGSFADADQKTLLDLIQTSGIYSYDPATVSSENAEDGSALMRYDVTVNAAALKTLNQKVGALMGLPQADVDAIIKQIDPDTLAKTPIKMYISPDAQRIVKVVITGSDNQTDTITYDGFNSSVVANEPTADFQYDEFQSLLTGQARPSLTGKAADSERKSDIDSLATNIEAFYNGTGFYPSFANVNDPEWIANNLKGVKETAFIDPAGTSKQLAAAPTANQYSYQPYANSSLASCAGGACRYFRVTATLSDGTTYSKASVH